MGEASCRTAESPLPSPVRGPRQACLWDARARMPLPGPAPFLPPPGKASPRRWPFPEAEDQVPDTDSRVPEDGALPSCGGAAGRGFPSLAGRQGLRPRILLTPAEKGFLPPARFPGIPGAVTGLEGPAKRSFPSLRPGEAGRKGETGGVYPGALILKLSPPLCRNPGSPLQGRTGVEKPSLASSPPVSKELCQRAGNRAGNGASPSPGCLLGPGRPGGKLPSGPSGPAVLAVPPPLR